MRAKKENIEAIKRSARRAAKKDPIQGLYTAVGWCDGLCREPDGAELHRKPDQRNF